MNPRDFAAFICSLAVLLFGALAGAALARRCRVPDVIGEILGGFVLGPTVLGALCPQVQAWLFPGVGPVFEARDGLAKLGLLLFLFVTGAEVHLSHLKAHRKTIAWTSGCGLVLPFAIGFAAVLLFPGLWGYTAGGPAFILPVFIGTAFSISALPVIARVLFDVGVIKSRIGTIILATATIDDIVGWILFGLVTFHFLPLGQTGMHPFLLWVFLVGVAFSRTRWAHSILSLRKTVLAFLAPIYFVSIGLQVDFLTYFDWRIVLLVLILASGGKLVGIMAGAAIAGLTPRDSLAVSFGANARGAVGIILAATAFQYHVIDERVYIALITMALVTTLTSGVALKRLLSGKG